MVVLYPKDTEKWKQFTTADSRLPISSALFCIPKILKNESNSQRLPRLKATKLCCFVSQRYWKMKAIHNRWDVRSWFGKVVLYPKDTEKWKQFTTTRKRTPCKFLLFCIPKILKNESNSQHPIGWFAIRACCFVSQRYWKMKAIHNQEPSFFFFYQVVLYPKDTEKWNLAKGKQGDSA